MTNYLGGAGNDILIYDLADQKIDGGDGTDVLRTDEAALGLLNSVGVQPTQPPVSPWLRLSPLSRILKISRCCSSPMMRKAIQPKADFLTSTLKTS